MNKKEKTMGNGTGNSLGRVAERKRHSRLVDFLIRLVKEKPLGTVGGVIILLILVTTAFAGFLAPYGFNESHVVDRLSPPSAQYWLGTDNLGRDMLSRVIFGARISMIVGLAATAVSAIIFTATGVISGYFGGKFDLVVQRLVDTWMCFPGLIIAMVIMSVVGVGMLPIIMVVGISMGIGASRIIRGATISIKGNVYIEAAVAIGCSNRRILTRHIMPNIAALIITICSIQVPEAIIIEASLSFLGLGVPPPAPSWGGMLSGAGRAYMSLAPWMAIWPGLALAITVYSVNMLGDAMRDLLDPRLRGGIGRYGVKVEKEAKK